MKNFDRGRLLVAIVILMIIAAVAGILFILVVVTKGWILAVGLVVIAVWMIYNSLDD